MDMEKMLLDIDFSGYSKVKDSLFRSLMEQRHEKSALSMEELDYVVAAGNPDSFDPRINGKKGVDPHKIRG